MWRASITCCLETYRPGRECASEGEGEVRGEVKEVRVWKLGRECKGEGREGEESRYSVIVGERGGKEEGRGVKRDRR